MVLVTNVGGSELIFPLSCDWAAPRRPRRESPSSDCRRRWASSAANTRRDEVTKTDNEGNETVVVDGIDDKRLLLDEREFFQVLTATKREGNTASRMVRDAWDGRPLINLTKHSPARCIKPHISIVGHITEDELRRELGLISMANGYANRFLFACVRRSNKLPFGGNLQQSAIDALGKENRDRRTLRMLAA
jgi:hypothetical protein